MTRIISTNGGMFGAQVYVRAEDRRTSPQFSEQMLLQFGPDVLWDRFGIIPAGSTGVGGSFWGNLSSWGDSWDASVMLSSDAKMGQRRQAVSGVTRNSSGTPVSGTQVVAVDQTRNVVVDTYTSDANGNYVVTTPYDGSPLWVWAYSSANTIEGALGPTTPA